VEILEAFLPERKGLAELKPVNIDTLFQALGSNQVVTILGGIVDGALNVELSLVTLEVNLVLASA